MRAALLTRRTAGLVLAWFIAFLAVAGVAPLAQAQPLDDSICTSAGVGHSGPQGGGDLDQHTDHTLKCFLCTGISAPPAAAAMLPPSMAAMGHALLPWVSAQLASLTRAPLPARGPPLNS